MKEILQRLGHVLYWAGCALAGVIFLMGIYIGEIAVAAVIAFLIWLGGRAFRYILAGT